MSKKQFITNLQSLAGIRNWSAFALSYKHLTHKSEYTCCALSFASESDLNETISAVLQSIAAAAECFEDIIEYGGEATTTFRCSLSSSHEIVKEKFNSFVECINHPDDTRSVLDFPSNAYLFRGELDEKAIYIIILHTPVYTFKKKKMFAFEQNQLKPVEGRFIQLVANPSLLIYHDTIYFLDSKLSGEKFFNIETTARTMCKSLISSLKGEDLCSNFDLLSEVATTGWNVRRSVNFNQPMWDQLKEDTDFRRTIAKRLEIPLTADGRIATGDKEACTRLFKGLCGKAVRDLVKDLTYEAPVTKPL